MAVTQSPTHADAIRAGLVAFLVLNAAIAAAAFQADAMPVAAARAVALAFFLLTVPFLVLAHEGGHYAAARLLGWRVPIIAWGGVTVRLSPLRFSLGAPAFGGGAAGAVIAVPVRDTASRWACAFISAGGPLVNLILAGAAGYAAALAAPDSTAASLYLVFAIISLVSGLYNLWPYLPGSDGRQLVASLLTRDDGQQVWFSARLAEQEIGAVRPRDWPAGLMAKVAAASAWANQPDWQLYLYAWNLDNDRVAAARSALDRSRGDPRIFAERAFVAAYFDRDAAAAHRHLAQSHSSALHHLIGYWRAEAAASVATGAAEMAHEALRKGRLLSVRSPYATAFDTEWFDAIERRLEELS
jgi:hypothetical protein